MLGVTNRKICSNICSPTYKHHKVHLKSETIRGILDCFYYSRNNCQNPNLSSIQSQINCSWIRCDYDFTTQPSKLYSAEALILTLDTNYITLRMMLITSYITLRVIFVSYVTLKLDLVTSHTYLLRTYLFIWK